MEIKSQQLDQIIVTGGFINLQTFKIQIINTTFNNSISKKAAGISLTFRMPVSE